MLLVLNLPLVGIFTRLLGLPYWLLMPLVVMVGFLGVYSINHSAFDLYMMVGFGVLGYVLRKLDISLVPLILGLLLGNDMEINLRRALSISNGDWSILVRSPIADGIYLLMLTLLVVAVVASTRRRRIGSND
jgi:putative tricarboxylic transport membrane protein